MPFLSISSFLAQTNTISMDTLFAPISKAATSFLSPLSRPSGFSSIGYSRFIIRNGHSSFGQISSHNLLSRSRRRSLMVEAKNGDEKKNSKVDSHSFKVKPDEATGPFPEAVLLKEKKVQEDGRALPEFVDEDEEELFESLTLQLESDLDADQMRHYEVVYLIHEDHVDKIDDVNTKIRDFLKETKGRVWRFSDWGMRRLAYQIQKANNAHYFLMNFELNTRWINQFKEMLDQDGRVIRHLVMKRDKAITEECPPPPEFHTLRADMADEYEVDDMEDEEEDGDDEWYDDDDDDDDEEEQDSEATADLDQENFVSEVLKV